MTGLIKDIILCPYCSGGRSSQEREAWGDMGIEPTRRICFKCLCCWDICDSESYLFILHMRLDKMEW